MADPAEELRRILNEAPVEEFVDRYKVASDVAESIVAHRPYASDIDILERALIPKRAYEQLVTQIIEGLGSSEAA